MSALYMWPRQLQIPTHCLLLLQAMLAVLARDYTWEKADAGEQMVWPVQSGALRVNIQRLDKQHTVAASSSSTSAQEPALVR